MISDSQISSANYIVSFIKSRPVVVRIYEDKINILGAFDIWKTRNKMKKQKNTTLSEHFQNPTDKLQKESKSIPLIVTIM